MSEGVTYSIREILDRIERKVDHLAEDVSQSLTEVRKQIAELSARVLHNENKIKEINDYGSKDMRSMFSRVTSLENQALTHADVAAALKERDNQSRAIGSHKLSIVGALIAGMGLLATIIFLINTLIGAH